MSTLAQCFIYLIFTEMIKTTNTPPRLITLVTPDKGEVDLRTLRAIRVLRPLKLVSGVPSRS